MASPMKQAQEEMTMDMTPMIDCVFLLMIFFVLVIDLSQQDLEDLILPKATYQEPDEKPPENRPVLNILQDGSVWYKGKSWYNPAEHQRDYSRILELLLYLKQTVVKPEDIEKTTIGGSTVELVNTPILIRADKWTEWHYVGKAMEQCANPKAAFWKVELAMSEEDKELKMLQRQRQ
jgi:biopolymer transport protein ExbD